MLTRTPSAFSALTAADTGIAVLHEHRLGDLDAERVRTQTRPARALRDEVGELGVRRAGDRRGSPRAGSGSGGSAPPPLHRAAARLLEHAMHRSARRGPSLRPSARKSWVEEAAVGMLPAGERLDADARSVVQRDDRLKEDAELVACHGAVQRVLRLVPSSRRGSRICSSKTSQRSLPRSSARYIAASASRSSASGRSVPLIEIAIPTLAVTNCSSAADPERARVASRSGARRHRSPDGRRRRARGPRTGR